MELEERIQIKRKENIVIKETIEYLIRNDFVIQNEDGSKFDMQKFLYLHAQLFEDNAGMCDGKVDGQNICLKVINAHHNNGFISFMPSNGFRWVILDYSSNLDRYMYFAMCIMNKVNSE